MAHIHTQPGQHDHTACAFIIRTDFKEPRMLLHTHRLLHMYLQVGGHVELHETPWATITHEVREESGYELSQLKLLQPPHAHFTYSDLEMIAHPIPFGFGTHRFGTADHFHTDTAFAFTTDQEPKHPPAAGESQDFKLVTRQELVDLPEGSIPANVRAAGLYVFDHLYDTWEAVDPTQYKTSL